MANIIEIGDLNAPELDVFARLTEAQLRQRAEAETGVFIAESPKVIELALNAGCAPVSLLMERKDISGRARDIISRCGGVPVYTADSALLERLTGYRLTRGMLCAMSRPALPSVEALCAGARRLAVLEGLADPTNVGCLFRSAAALGIDAVLVARGCASPLYRRAVRVSMGAVFQVPWTYVDSATGWGHRDMGIKLAAMALSDSAVDIDDERLKSEPRLALVIGNEGSGLTGETVAASDYTVRIPMFHGVDSLNAAAAGAVAFWETRVKVK